MAAEAHKADLDTEDLYVVVNHLARRFRTLDAELGLSASRFSVLALLTFHQAMTVGQLARAESVRSPSMTRLVNDLERDGLARRQPDSGDRRRSVVMATPSGRRLVHQARARKKQLLHEVLDGTDARDRAAIARVAGVLRNLTSD